MDTRFLYFGFIVLLFGGCAPKYSNHSPDINVSNAWDLSMESKKKLANESFDESIWWRNFADDTLVELLKKSAKNNKDIKIAYLNINTARAMKDAASAGFYPKVDAKASLQHQGVSKYSGMILPGMPMDKNAFSAGFDASWELDLFGGVQNTVDAASAKVEVARDEARWSLMSVNAEIAKNYIAYKNTISRHAIAKQKIDLQTDIVRIVEKKRKVGDASEFEVIKAKSSLYSMQSSLSKIDLDARLLIYRLSVLTGDEPEALVNTLSNIKSKNQTKPLDIVPIGLRSELLTRRPDIKSALDNLNAKNYELKAADADFFPKFFLTGSIASQTISFADLFKAGSGAWSLGPVINWPVFRGGEIAARVKAKDSETQIAALLYEKAVLNALEDAESGLSRYAQDMKSHSYVQKNIDEARKNLSLSKKRLEIGEDDRLSYLVSMQNTLSYEDAFEESRLKVLTDLVSLYKALGGGWDMATK